MTAPARKPRGEGAKYPTTAKIKYLVAAAKEAGIKVGGVECARDGTIRILSEAALPASGASDYDAWKAGKGA